MNRENEVDDSDLPVGASNTLDPAVAGQNLGVPAVTGIVSHLIGHVLSEPQPRVVLPRAAIESKTRANRDDLPAN